MFEESGIHIVGISGSLRTASMNSGLLRAASSLAPRGVTIEIASLQEIPFFNGDLDGPVQPAPVTALKRVVARADGLLLASPEYNYSFTGVLKNGIDWLSRPLDTSPLQNMPVALVGSGGRYGTVRSQLHMRQVLQSTNSLVMPKPEFMLALARNKFDVDGNLIDEGAMRDLEAFLKAFVAWIARVHEEQSI